MQRRTFVLTPLTLLSLAAGSTLVRGAQAAEPTNRKVSVAFSKMAPKGRPMWRDLDRMEPGDVSIDIDLWLRMDVASPPAGGVLIKPHIRIIEDSLSGRRPILNSINIEGRSAPNTADVHVVGHAEGLSHDDVFRPLGIEIGIFEASILTPDPQPGTTVSTIPDKESVIVVTCK